MNGVELIAAERARQVAEEGYMPAYDDRHKAGAMALAGACYALAGVSANPNARLSLHGRCDGAIHQLWPWMAGDWKPGDSVRNLVKAGALLAAEIDRLQRAQARCPLTPTLSPQPSLGSYGQAEGERGKTAREGGGS